MPRPTYGRSQPRTRSCLGISLGCALAVTLGVVVVGCAGLIIYGVANGKRDRGAKDDATAVKQDVNDIVEQFRRDDEAASRTYAGKSLTLTGEVFSSDWINRKGKGPHLILKVGSGRKDVVAAFCGKTQADEVLALQPAQLSPCAEHSSTLPFKATPRRSLWGLMIANSSSESGWVARCFRSRLPLVSFHSIPQNAVETPHIQTFPRIAC